jgi:hypothetical protein
VQRQLRPFPLTAFDDWDHAAGWDTQDFDALRRWGELKVLDDADQNGLHFQNSKNDSSVIDENNWVDSTYAKRHLIR